MSFATILFFFGLIFYCFSIYYYRTFLNPLGVFFLIWTLVPFLYSLHLSVILIDLQLKTYIVIYGALLFFTWGAILKTKPSSFYKKEIPIIKFEKWLKNKSLLFYYFFVLCAIIEMVIMTPPLLSDNPFSAYMTARGLPFLHFTVLLMPVAYCYILLNPDIKNWKKVMYFFPPLLYDILWLQRGIIIWFILMVIILLFKNISLRKQIRSGLIAVPLIFILVFHLGNLRTSSNFKRLGVNSFAKFVEMNTADFYAWPYMYLTAPLYNIDQTLSNKELTYRYGFDIIEPVFSVLQMDFIKESLFSNEDLGFEIIKGFNVPSYLYRIYLNFGYVGFVIIPFLLGWAFQYLFNRFVQGNLSCTVIFTFWFPFLMQSFHDFLLWNVGVMLSLILVMLFSFKFKIGKTEF